MEIDVRFRYISIKGDWERSKAEAAFLNTLAMVMVHDEIDDDVEAYLHRGPI